MTSNSRFTLHVSRFTHYISRLVLLFILLLGFALRLHRLGVQSLWYDEAVTAQVASQGISELTRWTAGDIQPPLYYYAVSGWTRLLGRGEWALRFPSVLWGVLTVPLMWILARRLFGRGASGEIAGLAAALLSAISPLYVYYAQEARMYTQLTFLGALAGYALLRAMAADTRKTEAIWWSGFVLSSVAMLYTHYFGAFLLLAYLLWFLIILVAEALARRTRPRAWRVLGQAALSAAAIALLYVPWLPAMLTRYRVDRSYWQGALKLGEALRHVAISFAAGAPETMLESDAVRLLPWFGLALGVSVLVLLLQGSRGAEEQRSGGAEEQRSGGAEERRSRGVGGRKALLLLLVWLVVPAIAVLVLASRTPKFNARYLMLVSPAYLLIMAGAIGTLLARPRAPAEALETDGIRNTQSVIRIIFAVALLAFIVFVSALSVHNWFTDPAFTKAQWREVAATVRAQKGPDDAVLLLSGHAWPAWQYYAPDIPAARLPDIDVLDVSAVLGFDSSATLGQILKGKRGAWLVTWQSEAVDPVGFVPHFLDKVGVEQPPPGQYWHVGLRHWALREGASLPVVPQPDHPDGANYGHQVALVGWDDPMGDRLTVYWRALRPLDRDYRVSLVVEDAAGQELGRWDGRPASYDYPTTRWQVGQTVFGQYDIPLRAGLAPGKTYVTLALYDATEPSGLDIMDVADNPAGKRVRLGPMQLTPTGAENGALP